MKKIKMLRQGLVVTINELRNLADELEQEWKNLPGIWNYKELIKVKYLIPIINKQPKCSDTWKIEG